MKATAKANGQPVPDEFAQDPAILAMRIKALENSLEKMVQAQAQNHMELKKAFAMTDAHLWVLKRICEDFAAGCSKLVEGKTELDYQAYFQEFNEYQLAQAEAAEAESAKKLAEAEKKAAEEAEQETEVFGGDQDVASP